MRSRRPTRQRPRRPKEPRAAEAAYILGLRRIWYDAQALAVVALLPLLRAWQEQDARSDDADDERLARDLRHWMARTAKIFGAPPPSVPAGIITAVVIRRQMDWLELQLGHLITSDTATGLIRRAARAADRHARDELGRVLRISLRREVPGLVPIINGFRDANVELIRTGLLGQKGQIHESLLPAISRRVEEAHASGLRVEVLMRDLRDVFGVSDARAELIARDQILKLNAQISQARMSAVGVSEYTWSTSKDERVREGHRELEGTKHSWDDPPITNEKRGERNHPGMDYQCRCVAVPVLPDTYGLSGSDYDTGT